MAIYSVLAIIVWYFTPRTVGGRFILPYLPALSIVLAACLHESLQATKKYSFVLGKFLIILIILVAIISIGYRFVANKKYLPVILGQETKEHFLSKNLNFSFGDFYDVDGYFKKNYNPNTDSNLQLLC